MTHTRGLHNTKGKHYDTVTDTHKGIKINMEESDIRFNINRKSHLEGYTGITINI